MSRVEVGMERGGGVRIEGDNVGEEEKRWEGKKCGRNEKGRNGR